jgi:hypothetical protein
MPTATIAKSSATKKRPTNKRNRKPAVPEWFNGDVHAGAIYIVSQEHPRLDSDGRRYSDIEAILELTAAEFVEVKRIVGELRGYATSVS